jgi:hypothetical protein
LELLQTIKEAQSAGLYADCQEGALSVGAFIESVEGEDNPRIAGTIALLAEYCELLYKAHKGEIGEKRLRKQLVGIENSVKNELAPTGTEVAFLSYNAGMSDSIESVYLAAKADPDCDAYWIPIPYYDRKPDGSYESMHCDGASDYPDYIECVDWREYDIEARRPDAIFTFNPYDGSNLVTSVHPDFYCERLRNLTDMLVYIPYFVTANHISEHFCTLAGCAFAHRVIVQSEEVRAAYVRAFKTAYGNGFGRPEDKFVALGSPKFDKVINTKREDCALPDAWREMIGDKKVIFYNTTVGAILAHDEQYLNKLRNLFDAFRNREDAVLWWRPHPLSEATYRSMRPSLAGAYLRVVADYKRGAYGIYDDTSDPHRAIAWSDACLAGGGSVNVLYGVTGKPMEMLTDVGLTREDIEKLIEKALCAACAEIARVEPCGDKIFGLLKECAKS